MERHVKTKKESVFRLDLLGLDCILMRIVQEQGKTWWGRIEVLGKVRDDGIHSIVGGNWPGTEVETFLLLVTREQATSQVHIMED